MEGAVGGLMSVNLQPELGDSAISVQWALEARLQKESEIVHRVLDGLKQIQCSNETE